VASAAQARRIPGDGRASGIDQRREEARAMSTALVILVILVLLDDSARGLPVFLLALLVLVEHC
jgi:hypothetical protein